MNITPEIISIIGSSFTRNKTPNTVKTRPCRIMFNSFYITTNSGKTVWRNKGFAKSALLNHLQSSYDVCGLVGGYFNVKNLSNELEKAGLIQYIEVDIENFAVRKQY